MEDPHKSDAVERAALGTRFDEAIADFAEEYAGQNERDFERLERAIDEGRVAIVTDL